MNFKKSNLRWVLSLLFLLLINISFSQRWVISKITDTLFYNNHKQLFDGVEGHFHPLYTASKMNLYCYNLGIDKLDSSNATEKRICAIYEDSVKTYYCCSDTKKEWVNIDERFHHGAFTAYFYSTQKVSATGNLCFNEPSGVWIYYHESNSAIKAKGEYIRGRKVGLWNYCDSTGQITQSYNYSKWKSIPEKSVKATTFYLNGSIQSIYDFCVSENEWITSDAQGVYKIFFDDFYLNGMFLGKDHTGKYLEYYENGQVKIKRNYKTGSYLEYYTNGTIKMEGKYNKNGFQTGTWYLYSLDGTKEKKVFNK
ncbi:MAG: hypothetical protein ACKOXB_07300 [Flavobacteriales bacterium]